MNFNSEKIGYKISSAHECLSKKYPTFITIHDQKLRQIYEPIKIAITKSMFLVIYEGSPACENKSWCKSLFNGACLALGKREERRKYGEYCPIECRKEECAFEWEGGLVEHKIETNNDCKGRFC